MYLSPLTEAMIINGAVLIAVLEGTSGRTARSASSGSCGR